MTEQPPSIVEVAKAAGVSLATASRVLSNADYPVSRETRERVLAAAAHLRYAPNLQARSLKARRSRLVAVLVGDNVDPYFAEIVRGVEEITNAHGYMTIVCNTERLPEKELHYLKTLQDYRVDGVIFAGGGLNEPGHPQRLAELLADMQRRGAAVIALAPHQMDIPSIQPDNFGGAHAIVRYLLGQGHDRIAFVSGPGNLIAANARLQGYMAALLEAGQPIDHHYILPGNFDRQSGEQAAQTIASMTPAQRPSAIFAANDETAFGVIHGLTQSGWHLPADCSVVGFGDLPMAQLITPPLTTVRVDLRELGRIGTLRLLALLHGETVPHHEVFPSQIIERDSTRQQRRSPDGQLAASDSMLA